ncbi:N-acyl-D-glutamate deacylase [bacterium HR33]|nr:N-acyl-D-glutamate deacylase [bacterium HR33]
MILRGGLVYDGTGAPPREADVAIAGDRIEAIGAGLEAPGAEIVRVDGLAVAPGFIDIHSHSDLVLLVDPLAQSKVRQGVTTEVAGQDGSSIGPWSEARFQETRAAYRSRYGIEIDFRDLAGFFKRLERDKPAVNLASMVGHGTVRSFVMGDSAEPASEKQRREMAELVERALQEGACGVSSGLEYLPGAFADLEELAEIARPLAPRRLPYASHLRNEDDRLLAAVEEAINVGRRAGVPVHISHLKAQGQRNWWKADPLLEVIDRAAASGIDLSFDVYPYVAYSTGLSNLFPVWAREGGTEAFLARLADPSLASRIEVYVRDKIAQLGSWDAVQISNTGADSLAWARGRRLGELAGERGTEPYQLLVELVVKDRNRSGMIGFGMSEENVLRFLRHRAAMVCSDGSALAAEGPLAQGSPHPRNFGAFPRVLGYVCRERRALSLEQAIHKMTAVPARLLRLEGRGVLAPGSYADVVVFDPATVADRATFERPHQYPVGIPHVMVNGQWVLRDGEHTGARPGRVLRPR